MGYRGKRRAMRAVEINGLDSVHDPKDPDPEDVLPEQAQDEWKDSFDEGMSVYGADDLAEKSAWREIRLRWQEDGKGTWQRCQNGSCYWPPAIDFPEPQTEPVSIGVLIEYVLMDKNGDLHVVKLNGKGMNPPRLYWDDKLKACFAFPGMPYAECSLDPSEVSSLAREVYERWHKREAKCFDDIKGEFPSMKVKAEGAGDSLSYASDKWNDPDPDPTLTLAQQYIHNHWYDVWVYQDVPAGDMPSAIMIVGGELDLHERGLIH